MLKLRAAFSPNPRIRPLVEGLVRPRDIELDFTIGGAGELFEWHLKGSDCDVFEFSISHHLTVVEKDDPRWDWLAIPVFLSKAMPGLGTYVRGDSGITSPGQLGGARFGVPDFSMTGAVWLRILLRRLYGIAPQDITWFAGRPRELSHDLALGIAETIDPSISATWLFDDRALARMMAGGELDAGFTGGPGTADDWAPGARPLFTDGGQSFFADFFRAAGFLPVNHAVMIRRRLVAEHPWVAEALFDAFEASKQAAYRQDPSSALVFPKAGPETQRSLFGADPFVSGLAANRPMLEMVAREALEEGLVAEPANVDGLFFEGVRAT